MAAPKAGDLVLVTRGEVMVADRLVMTAGKLTLATLGYRLSLLTARPGTEVKVLELAPSDLPEDPGFYLDNTSNVWEGKGNSMVRLVDGVTITAVPEGRTVTRLMTLADAAAEIADYFQVIGWPDTAQRIREQYGLTPQRGPL